MSLPRKQKGLEREIQLSISRFVRDSAFDFSSTHSSVGFGVRVPVAATKPVRCSAVVVESGKGSGNVEEKSVSVILLAGGKGNRMGVAWGCLWCSEFCWIGSDVILNFAWQEDSRIVSGVNVVVIVVIRCCYRM